MLPQIKEYERVSTTVVNAYVEPAVRRYLTNLEKRLTEAGFKGSLFIMLSHGGMAPVEEASRLAAGTVLSGPAGGVSGGRRCAELLGIGDLVPFDMGGTSTDISLIADGQRFALRRRHAGGTAHRAAQPRYRQHRGRRRLDRQRRCRRHAAGRPGKRGLDPGPGLLRQWRTAATVTDANVVLGYLDADAFMGGARPLDRAASEAAVDRVAASLGAVAAWKPQPASTA